MMIHFNPNFFFLLSPSIFPYELKPIIAALATSCIFFLFINRLRVQCWFNLKDFHLCTEHATNLHLPFHSLNCYNRHIDEFLA